MDAKQTPLIELLERVSQDARVVVEHDQFSSTSHPVGRLCHEAAAALRAALAEPEQEPISLNNGRLTQYPDGSVGVGTPAEPEHEPFMVVAPECAERGCMAHDDRVDGSGVVLHLREKQEPQTTHWEGCEAVHPECKVTPRKPLTDEEMRECAQAMNAEPLAEGWPELIKFARAIERAHGIGEGQ